MIKLTINQKLCSVDAPPDMPLLWVLRDLLGLTGIKLVVEWRNAHPARCILMERLGVHALRWLAGRQISK